MLREALKSSTLHLSNFGGFVGFSAWSMAYDVGLGM